jgi:hypothetical protein
MCNLNRNPLICRNLRTAISGAVWTPRILLITQLRFERENTSVIFGIRKALARLTVDPGESLRGPRWRRKNTGYGRS